MTGALPLYRSVYAELRRRIEAREYGPGSAIPPERRLIDDFHVSLITVRRALDELVLDGLIERRQGVGSFVREQPRTIGVDQSRFTADVVNGRLRLVRTLLDDSLAPAGPEAAARLAVQPGSLVRRLSRLDCEGGIPFSIDEVFIPPALAATVSVEIASSPEFMNLWKARAGLTLGRTEYEVSVQMASADDQRTLRVGPECPLLVTGELVTGSAARPLLWVVTRYRGDRTRLCGSFDMRDPEAQGQ
jgi:GntR family transcriptional regulator